MTPQTANREQGARPLRVLALLAVVCLLAYSNSFPVVFHFDDVFSIVDNSRVHSLGSLGRILRENPTRALPEITFALNYALGGESVWGYHLVSLALHVAAAWTVWWLATLLFESRATARPPLGRAAPTLALLVALAFALHPVQTQAVTYLSQRSAVLAALFYMLAAAAYLRFRIRGGPAFYAAALACAILAALSKPNAASLPLIVVFLETLFSARPAGAARRALWIAPFALPPLLVAGFTFGLGVRSVEALQQVGIGVTGLPSMREYALTQIDVVRTYWRLVFLPLGLNLDYDYPLTRTLFSPSTLASLALHLAALAAAALLILRNRRLEAFGILWFYVALSVESSIVPLSDVIMEHRLYLALFGPLLSLGAACATLLLAPRMRAALFVAALLLLALTWRRNLVWHDRVSLWTDVAEKSPCKKRALYNAANALYNVSRFREAEPYYVAALALEPPGSVVPEREGLPVRPPAIRELAHLYVKTGQTDKALDVMPEAIAWHPEDAGLWNDFSIALMRAGRFAEAVEPARRAVQKIPEDPAKWTNLGLALLRSEKSHQAREALQKARLLAPSDAKPLVFLSEIEQAAGNPARAAELLQQAIALVRAQKGLEAVAKELEARLDRLRRAAPTQAEDNQTPQPQQ